MEFAIKIRINDDVPEKYQDIVMVDIMDKVKEDLEKGNNQGELISEFDGDDGEELYFRGWWSKESV